MKRGTLAVFSASLAFFVTNLDASIVNICLPKLCEAFEADTSKIASVVLLYLLALCSLMLVMGRISDIIGPKRVFVMGLVVFTAASLVCGLSRSLEELWAGRFIQGVGGAMLFAAAGPVIIKNVPESSRGKALSFLTVFGGVGFALGAPLGGQILGALGWRWVFFINVLPGILGALLSAWKLPPDEKRAEDGAPFDFAGAATSFLALSGMVCWLNQGEERGWSSPGILGVFVLSLAMLALFFFVEKRCNAPLLDPSLFSDKTLLAATLSSLIVVMNMDGINFLFPFYFEHVRHDTAQVAGMFLGIFPLVSILMSPVAGAASDKFGAARLTVASAGVLLASSILFWLFSASSSGLFISLSLLLFGVGMATFLTSDMSLVMGRAPAGKEGATSALLMVNQSLGSVLGITLFETVFSFGERRAGPDPILQGFSQSSVLAGYRGAAMVGAILCAITLLITLTLLSGSRRPSGHARES